MTAVLSRLRGRWVVPAVSGLLIALSLLLTHVVAAANPVLTAQWWIDAGEHATTTAEFTLADVDLSFTVEPLAYGNILLVSEEGRVAHFVRAMADFAASDGRRGRGWIEWEFVLD